MGRENIHTHFHVDSSETIPVTFGFQERNMTHVKAEQDWLVVPDTFVEVEAVKAFLVLCSDVEGELRKTPKKSQQANKLPLPLDAPTRYSPFPLHALLSHSIIKTHETLIWINEEQQKRCNQGWTSFRAGREWEWVFYHHHPPPPPKSEAANEGLGRCVHFPWARKETPLVDIFLL